MNSNTERLNCCCFIVYVQFQISRLVVPGFYIDITTIPRGTFVVFNEYIIVIFLVSVHNVIGGHYFFQNKYICVYIT